MIGWLEGFKLVLNIGYRLNFKLIFDWKINYLNIEYFIWIIVYYFFVKEFCLFFLINCKLLK